MPDSQRSFRELTRAHRGYIFLLVSVVALVACFYFIGGHLPASETIVNSRELLDIFIQSPSAREAGFNETETLSLAAPPFFQAYSNLVSRLAAAQKKPFAGSVNHLVATAMLIEKAVGLEQRRAVIQVFFRYYPDVLSDPLAFARVVVLLDSAKMFEKNELIRPEIRQTTWRLAGAAIERAKASGVRSLPELAELIVLFPELDVIVREALNPTIPVAEPAPSLSETLPPTEIEDAT